MLMNEQLLTMQRLRAAVENIQAEAPAISVQIVSDMHATMSSPKAFVQFVLDKHGEDTLEQQWLALHRQRDQHQAGAASPPPIQHRAANDTQQNADTA
jgi:hypothetical protein